MADISGRDAFWTYLLSCGVYKLLFHFPGKVLCTDRRHLVAFPQFESAGLGGLEFEGFELKVSRGVLHGP